MRKKWMLMSGGMAALVAACGSGSGASSTFTGSTDCRAAGASGSATASSVSGVSGVSALSSALASQKISHIPPVVRSFADRGQVSSQQVLPITVSLKINNQADLEQRIAGMYTPGSSTYHQFMTTDEFRARYSPTQQQIAQVQSFLQSHGIQASSVDPNGYFIHASGTAAAVGQAFQTSLHQYTGPDGTQYFAPSVEPVMPSDLGIQAVHGLQNVTRWHSYAVARDNPKAPVQEGSNPKAGSGPSGGYAPQDIKTAYQFPSNLNGSGQTLGLMELDGYNASDIQAYESQFGLANVSLQNVLIDGATGTPGSGIDEVTLDIELMAAVAPGASQILVYEGANSSQGILDLYSRIASDNKATEVSSSWGSAEGSNTTAFAQSENTVFEQMAAQGQSMFSAAGDSGADDNGSSLSVDDPSAQPFVTGVGGTSLTTGSGGSYGSETTWNDSGGAGGGGISSVWPQPSYQSGLATSQNEASSSMRNVPDVALNADPTNGYSIYVSGSWSVWGGTSAAAPLWAGFAALVNQQRLSSGLGPVGFMNPALYAIGRGGNYSSELHDIADGSNNGHYPAVSGYDDATGWGSLIGSTLLQDLASDPQTSGC